MDLLDVSTMPAAVDEFWELCNLTDTPFPDDRLGRRLRVTKISSLPSRRSSAVAGLSLPEPVFHGKGLPPYVVLVGAVFGRRRALWDKALGSAFASVVGMGLGDLQR
jgi:hypothetical protein